MHVVNRFFLLPLLVTGLGSLGCSGDSNQGPGNDNGTDAGQDSSPKRITFIHVNDFHANLVPHSDMIRDTSAPNGFRIETRGGAARIATVIEEIRANEPSSIAMNIGDTFHGGVEALYTDGEAIYDVVAAMGFDVGVPGNWDFAFGPHVSWMRYRGADQSPPIFSNQAASIRLMPYENLAANATVEADSTAGLPGFFATQFSAALEDSDETPWLPATTTKMVNGVQVGMIGITSDFVPRMHEMMGMGIEFDYGQPAYLALIADHATRLRSEGCGVVVVMSELSVHKDYAMAKKLEPGLIDVFFSAHTHELTEKPLVAPNGTLVVEAGNDGWVGQLSMNISGNGEVLSTDWILHAVDESVADDPDVLALVNAARAPFLGDDVSVTAAGDAQFSPSPIAGKTISRSIETVIGSTDRLLHRHDALGSEFNNLFTDMMIAYTNADAAISPGFRYDVPLAPEGWDVGNGVVATGEITLEQAYRYFPAPYTLGLADSNKLHMRSTVESMLTFVFSTDVWNQGGGWMEGLSGFDVILDLTAADGARISSFSHSTKVLADNETITIAGCRRPNDTEGTLCSYSGFSNARDIINPDTQAALTPVELLEWGFAQADRPESRTTLVDTSNSPQWPVSEFVQPLEGLQ